ncbi:hypothetical protein SAMN05421812_102269 [Asanoa hainanensis]|uniref:Uncharacterized protein n=1 Tax=Asanoa hainanensis TaxID=560556 RepID=A0A239IBG0_9ACTN|nr:hypothetical protein [Asanoa hainanensis]SNS89724.1 hypothetical protein SAMN05421812_102269 [Asanoa hainanensis]
MTTSADYDDDLDERVEDETLIDDLFTFEEDDEPARRGGRSGTGLRWWIKATFAGAALAAVAIFGLRVAGYTVPIVALVGVIVALVVLRRVTSALVPSQMTRQRRRSTAATEDGSYNFTDRDALRTVVGRWERLLQRAGGDAGSARAVQRTLAEIVDERLRQRHGLTRAGDPERARALLGEPLWTYLATPPTRNLAPRDATAYVQSLERL